MTVVHQLLASAAPHDAVTDQALELHRLLTGWGYDARLFAEHVHPGLRGTVRGIERRPRDADVVLLRYSIWSRAVDDVLADRPRSLGMVFHNVTPPEWIEGVNADVARWCRMGRERLGELRDRVDLVVTESAYDARDLQAAGFTDVRVVPMLLDLPRRDPAPRLPGAPPTVLSVGRVVPNKRLEVAIRAFALFQARHAPDARLVLVGSWESFEPYHEALVRFVHDLGVRNVDFRGRVSAEERDRWYREADAYLCTSAHEGFCAPLAEAMASQLPVVAVDEAAVPETLAGGGLVVPDGDPCLIAEAVHEVMADPELRARLRDGADARLADFDRERVADRIREVVDSLVAVSAARS
ncbi:MAG: glycosyltransferase [Thermoleophilia bacterium]